MPKEPTTQESLDHIGTLADGLTSRLEGCLGKLARPTGRFHAYEVVTRAIQRVRLDLINGATLTPDGHRWITSAVGYLAFLAIAAWHRRGLSIEAMARLGLKDRERMLAVGAFRHRNGELEHYSHDVLRDVYSYLLKPPQMLPTLHGRLYALTSLALPPPEYLYLYGLFLTYSAHAVGSWPKGERVGGLEDDFNTARSSLVDDLHEDTGLPTDEPALRQLSWWVVFPPYGWDMNDGQEYNMMTLVDQILFKNVVPRNQAEQYLRALLRCQTFHIRNLAARTLLTLGKGPVDPEETTIFTQALNASDHSIAEGAMARFAWRAEGRAQDTAPTPEWIERRRATWHRMVDQAPTEPWRQAPVLSDPEYLASSQLQNAPREQQHAALRSLEARFPGDWFIETALGTFLVHSQSPHESRRGEEMLRACVNRTPDCPTAHLALGTALKYQDRRDEALAIFKDAVRRWPWHNQAIDSCLWMLTDGLTITQS